MQNGGKNTSTLSFIIEVNEQFSIRLSRSEVQCRSSSLDNYKWQMYLLVPSQVTRLVYGIWYRTRLSWMNCLQRTTTKINLSYRWFQLLSRVIHESELGWEQFFLHVHVLSCSISLGSSCLTFLLPLVWTLFAPTFLLEKFVSCILLLWLRWWLHEIRFQYILWS